MQKIDATAPHEIMLVVDAGTGQNAINQVQEFDQAVGLTGLTITKLDGTAKGGVLFNIASRTHVPIRFIGVGEKIDDLRPFLLNHLLQRYLKLRSNKSLSLISKLHIMWSFCFNLLNNIKLSYK